MRTKFKAFTQTRPFVDRMYREADEFMAEVEAGGGQYVDSHLTVTESADGTLYALVVVYRVAEWSETGDR